jgi:hypothetical protein
MPGDPMPMLVMVAVLTVLGVVGVVTGCAAVRHDA